MRLPNPAEEPDVVYVAVPMKDGPAIFVPSTSRQRYSSPATSRPFVKAALGFAVTTLLWALVPMPCHHSMLRGAPPKHHGMGHHGHPGNYVMMHDMMHPHHEHGMGHHQHSGDYAMIHGTMMHPHEEGNRRWKDMEISSNRDGMDGWYAGNKSHDGWHASLMNSESYDSSDSADDNGTSDNAKRNDNVVKTQIKEVERVEMEKEDGMIPGLP
jgi:hypothetical protein